MKYKAQTLYSSTKNIDAAIRKANFHSDTEQREKTFNTIAALSALSSHFKKFGIKSFLTKSDSWNPGLQLLFHPTDLLTEAGRLRVIILREITESIELKHPAWDDISANLVIQIGSDYGEYKVLGYEPERFWRYPRVLNVSELRPLHELTYNLTLHKATLVESKKLSNITHIQASKWVRFLKKSRNSSRVSGVLASSGSSGLDVPNDIEKVIFKKNNIDTIIQICRNSSVDEEHELWLYLYAQDSETGEDENLPIGSRLHLESGNQVVNKIVKKQQKRVLSKSIYLRSGERIKIEFSYKHIKYVEIIEIDALLSFSDFHMKT